jgi:hypothetical protein
LSPKCTSPIPNPKSIPPKLKLFTTSMNSQISTEPFPITNKPFLCTKRSYPFVMSRELALRIIGKTQLL